MPSHEALGTRPKPLKTRNWVVDSPERDVPAPPNTPVIPAAEAGLLQRKRDGPPNAAERMIKARHV